MNKLAVAVLLVVLPSFPAGAAPKRAIKSQGQIPQWVRRTAAMRVTFQYFLDKFNQEKETSRVFLGVPWGAKREVDPPVNVLRKLRPGKARIYPESAKEIEHARWRREDPKRDKILAFPHRDLTIDSIHTASPTRTVVKLIDFSGPGHIGYDGSVSHYDVTLTLKDGRWRVERVVLTMAAG